MYTKTIKKFLVSSTCAFLSVALVTPTAQAFSLASSTSPSLSQSSQKVESLTEKDGEVIGASIKKDKNGKYYFDTSYAIQNGISKYLANNLHESIEKYNAMSGEELNAAINKIPSTASKSSGEVSTMMSQDQRRCLITFATTAGVNLGSLVGVFMTGGWGAVVLISGVAAANANVIADCYDDNGKPIL